MTHVRTALALVLALAAAGCGGEAVAGGQRDVTVDATGDGAGASPERRVDPRTSRSAAAAVQGTVDFAARVRLNGGTVVPVGSLASVRVRADGGDTARVVAGRVPGSAYATVRLVFYDVTAQVTGGLLVGGTPLTGQVEVEIAPGDSLVVERTIVAGAGGGDIRLLVDLNSAVWLAAANPTTRVVAATVFRNAVQVESR